MDVNNYQQNYLTNVIFRVDFPKILELDINKPPVEFQKKIYKNFPILNEIPRDGVKFKVEPENGFQGQEFKEISWEFWNKEKTKKVYVDSTGVFIEYFNYDRFQEFFDDIKLVFENFIELYPIEVANRVGLRYINQIGIDEGEPMDWNGLIHENLFKINNEFASEDDDILRSMHILEIKEDECYLRFQFGMFNSEYPQKITRREFILDYDCFMEEQFEITDIFKKSNEFNVVIYKWFDKSIEKGLKDIMGVI